MSYESPIKINYHEQMFRGKDVERMRQMGDLINRTTEEFAARVTNGVENSVYMQVNAVVDVDKEELIRALKYDREQYEKGYADGKRDAMRWIPVSERLPEIDEEVIVYVPGAGCQVMWLNQPDQETADIYWVMEHGWWCEVDEVTHWMQLPQPPEVNV